jgi:1-hydroxycarotenoid 3,4-desaturase
MTTRNLPVAVIGAGIGGLSAALALVASGAEVEVFEAAAEVGGKLRQVPVDSTLIDSGPTVFTMRWVFEELFAEAGTSFDRQVQAQPLSLLARHAWDAGQRLDLHADLERSVEAIGEFAGAAESRRYQAFCDQAGRTYRTLEKPFLNSQRPDPLSLTARVAAAGLSGLRQIQPFASLAQALRRHFRDPRLQQLFGRYATYCGSSPFLAPATLMLVSHVERQGVWHLQGGMQRLAAAMQALAEARGVRFHFNATVREIGLTRGRVSHLGMPDGSRHPCSAIVCNADPAALREGLFGAQARAAIRPRRATEARSLSAVTWCLHTRAEGFPLSHHNVFFSSDYGREFDDILLRHRLPGEPTVYVCAQDRQADAAESGAPQERLLCLVNAPATGDRHHFDFGEIELCATRTFRQLARCGLHLQPGATQAVVTTPNDFARRFPATGGALYGQPSHGWRASFSRPGSRSAIPGLYLAGGGVHPGPGLPMAALSGRLAAASLLQDLTSPRPFRRMAITGGISTP